MTIDDSWLKLAQLMWMRDRKASRMARKQFFVDKNVKQWAILARQDIVKQK